VNKLAVVLCCVVMSGLLYAQERYEELRPRGLFDMRLDDAGVTQLLEFLTPLTGSRTALVHDALFALPERERPYFIHQFWKRLGEAAGVGNVGAAVFQTRIVDALAQFGTLDDDRARALVLYGQPTRQIPFNQKPRDGTFLNRCQGYRTFSVWQWDGHNADESFTLVFINTQTGVWKLWSSGRLEDLYQTELLSAEFSASSLKERECAQVFSLLRNARKTALSSCGNDPLEPCFRQGQEGRGWLETLESMSRQVLEERRRVSVSVSARACGARQGTKVPVCLSVAFPNRETERIRVGEKRFSNIVIDAAVYQGDELVREFYRRMFLCPEDAPVCYLDFEDVVVPGSYTLRVHCYDKHSDVFGVAYSELHVPLEGTVRAQGVPVEAVMDAQQDSPSSNKKVRKEEAGRFSLAIEGVASLVFGKKLVSVFANSSIVSVAFFCDGDHVVTKHRPPFQTDIDFGEIPHRSVVEVVGYDKNGVVVTKARAVVNEGIVGSSIKINECVLDRERQELVLRGTMRGEKGFLPKSLEIYLGQRQIATASLRESRDDSFHVIVQLSKDDATSRAPFIVVSGALPNGGRVEDVFFFRERGFVDSMIVGAVEVPVVVLNRDLEPIEGLSMENFRVWENNTPQTLQRVLSRDEVPVRLGIVVDVSWSMEKILEKVRVVAQGFLSRCLSPNDSAFVEVFSLEPSIVQGETSDQELLSKSLTLSLYPTRMQEATSLYDSIMYGLLQFSALGGKKVMVVLTDGQDLSSLTTLEDVVRFARSCNVTLYVVMIARDKNDMAQGDSLRKLAQVTGGDLFVVDAPATIDGTYEAIEKAIRSSYLLVYTSSIAPSRKEEMRSLRVQVEHPDAVRVQAPSGYVVRHE